MKKTIAILLGLTLLGGSAIQGASAPERHRAHKAARAAPVSEQVRNSNAYLPAPQAQPDYNYYANRGLSAPAGR